jgi:hypothetical protein
MIAEPTSATGLWPQVAAESSYGWPTSNEDQARALAGRWRAAAQSFTDAAAFDTTPVTGAWPDTAGVDFTARVRGELESALATSDGMRSLADRVDHFADVVIGVKNAIRNLIEINLAGYAATKNLAPEDRDAVRDDFVIRLAAEVDRIVTAGIAQLGGPPPTPAAPPPEPDTGDLGDLVADFGARANALGNALLDRPDLGLALAGGIGATALGSAGVLGGGGLAVTGIGAVPGGAVLAGSYALAGTGAVTTAAAWESLMVEARTQDGGTGSAAASPGPKLTWEPSPKHGREQRGRANPAPTNPEETLGRSVPLGPNTARRVSADPKTGEYAVFDETYPGTGVYHGHARSWDELKQPQKNALVRGGLTDRRGRILEE